MSVQSTKKVTKASYSFDEGHLFRELISDVVIVEQPLQVTLSWYQDKEIKETVFAITMRTPNHDEALIIGLLFSEGIIRKLDDIESIMVDEGEENNNQWLVQFSTNIIPELASLERYQMTYSSCGLCGVTSLNALELKNPIKLTQAKQELLFPAKMISTLSGKLSRQQALFSQTGGVHGAALFDQQANLVHSFEDIGRHNAVDKVIGKHLQEKVIGNNKQVETLAPHQVCELLVLLVSGRISFEIVQKTVMAGFSILVGVGAPSDLAIQAAQRFDLTLIGFVSEHGFNVYHGDWRLMSSV